MWCWLCEKRKERRWLAVATGDSWYLLDCGHIVNQERQGDAERGDLQIYLTETLEFFFVKVFILLGLRPPRPRHLGSFPTTWNWGSFA